ncbi:MAG: Gfo/Idh/MocA family oxidoreductase [Vicinamibacterales bacterium]
MHTPAPTVLVIGYSNIAARRVLPALWSTGVRGLEVASTSATAIDWPGDTPRRFHTYEEALAESRADLVYISTVNSAHAALTARALDAGFHVVVDKPAALALDDVRDLAVLAESRGRVLAEAVVWAHHPQVARARQVFDDAGCRPTHLWAAFSFPPLPPGNFRMRAGAGGGMMNDLGPYAVTCGREFFGDAPVEVVGRVLSATGDVDTGFSLLARYPDGRSTVGSFSCTTGYVNRLEVAGPGVVVGIERAFSPPGRVACGTARSRRRRGEGHRGGTGGHVRGLLLGGVRGGPFRQPRAAPGSRPGGRRGTGCAAPVGAGSTSRLNPLSRDRATARS